MRSSPLFALFMVAAAAGCEAPTTPLDESDFARDCSDPGGTVHTAPGIHRWTRAASPHRFATDLKLASLTIDPGAVVCGGQSARLDVGVLHVVGTSALPVLMSAEPGATWGGLRLGLDAGLTGTFPGPLSRIRHAVIERAELGVVSQRILEMDSSVVRQVEGRGVNFGRGHLRGVRVEDACAAGGGCTAIYLAGYGQALLDDVIVRNSGAIGVSVGWRGQHVLGRLRIEGSRGVGLETSTSDGDIGVTGFVGPIRITGGATYPLHTKLRDAQNLLATSFAQDSLTGNADDYAFVYAGIGGGAVTIRPGLAWHLHGYDLAPPLFELSVEPGSELRLSGGVRARVRAAGTPDRPVLLRGVGATARLTFAGGSGDSSSLVHVRLDNLTVSAQETHALRLSHVAATNVHLALLSPGSSIGDAHLTGSAGGTPQSTLMLGASTSAERVEVTGSLRHGILIAGGNATVSTCQVTGSALDGVHVTSAVDVRVNGCNLYGNAGLDLRNAGTVAVDAIGNWWGDAAGPLRPGGARIAGPVLFAPFRSQPAPFPTPAPGD